MASDLHDDLVFTLLATLGTRLCSRAHSARSSPGHDVGQVAYECHHYSLLTDVDRNIKYGTLHGKCDNNLADGWYRLAGAAGTEMPNSCQGPDRCDARYPGWLYGVHPKPRDGCVERHVCFGNALNGCCLARMKVLVRNCGGYYVYKLGPVPGCNFRFCGLHPASKAAAGRSGR